MKPSRSLVLLVASLLSSAAACATTERVEIEKKPGVDNSSTIPAVADAIAFCTSLCDRQQACDQALDHQTCKNNCENLNAATFPKLRGEVVNLIVECFGAKDCKTVLTGDVVGTCADEAVASVAPSAAASQYCEALDAAKKKCGSSTSAKATCLNQAKLYDEKRLPRRRTAPGARATRLTRASAPPSERLAPPAPALVGRAARAARPARPARPDRADSSGSSGSSASCQGQFADLASCQTCAEGSCCTAAAQCAADSTCRGLMRVCSYEYASSTGSSSYCSQYLSSAPSSSRSLLDAYFACASSSCTSGCASAY